MKTHPERLRICPRCAKALPLDHRCGGSPAADPSREKERLRRKRRLKGYDSAHWAALSAKAIARYGNCLRCGAVNDLTAHLLPERGEDHSRAKLGDVIVVCRRCHGRIDGGRR